MSDRRRFHEVMDELDRLMEEVERELEKTIKNILESDEFPRRPLLYGFCMDLDSEGQPIVRTFGDLRDKEAGYREPVHDQIVDSARGVLKLLVELPGVEKKDIQIRFTEQEVTLTTAGDDTSYRANIPLKAAVDPSNATASHRNGLLEVTFKLKDKTNKEFKNIKVE